MQFFLVVGVLAAAPPSSQEAIAAYERAIALMVNSRFEYDERRFERGGDYLEEKCRYDRHVSCGREGNKWRIRLRGTVRIVPPGKPLVEQESELTVTSSRMTDFATGADQYWGRARLSEVVQKSPKAWHRVGESAFFLDIAWATDTYQIFLKSIRRSPSLR